MMNVKVKKYPKDAIIYLEKTTELNKFYILKKGQVKIIRIHPLKGEQEDIRSEGFIFGIRQCITGIPEAERAVALCDCEVIIIEKSQITQVYSDSPSVIMKILAEYSEILRNLDSDLLQQGHLESLMNRDELVISTAAQYVETQELAKAGHLLTSYINENPHNQQALDKAKKMVKNLPGIKVGTTTELVENRTFGPGEVIFVEYERGESLFIIKSGRVKITNIRKGKELVIAVLAEGAILGEMSVLNDKPRNATAVAETLCVVTVVDKKSINHVPAPLFYKILEHLTNRIWMTEQMQICANLHNPLAKVYYYLASTIRQSLKIVENDDTSSFVYKSSRNELYNMVDLSLADRREMEDFERDHNIAFYENVIRIKNIKLLFDKNAFYLSRLAMSMNKTKKD